MKKNKLYLPLAGLTIVAVAIALIVLTLPRDTIISPYLNEPIVDLNKSNVQKEFNQTTIFDNMEVEDMVVLPDNSVISVGQSFSGRNIFVPVLKRTNFGGGAVWTSALNPLFEDGIVYNETGTSYNSLNRVIYVNQDLIYVIGTITAQVIDTDLVARPIQGVFANQQVPVGDDLLVFVASFAADFSNFKIHGFITPPDEPGYQGTVIADVTLLDATTLVMTGVTNSHAGLFASAPIKSTFDFVISLEMGETMTLNHLFTFNNSSYVQPTQLYALADGDLIVSGTFQEADGDFTDIPLTQLVETPAFIARIDGETFSLTWVSSNLYKNTVNPAVTLFVNVLELDNHDLVTIANVWKANESYDKVIQLNVFTQTGELQTQKVINVNNRQAYAIQLYKATTGYWIAGSIKEDLQYNVMLMKLSSGFQLETLFEIRGSGQEIWLVNPFVQNEGKLVLPIGTYSKDQDFLTLNGLQDNYIKLFLLIS